LHRGKEELRLLGFGIVIYSHGKDFTHAQIGSLFAGAYIANAGKKFIKVVCKCVIAFKAFIIQNKAFLEIFAKMLSCPDAKLGAALGSNPIADCKNHFKTVIPYVSTNLAVALILNC